MKTRTSCYSSSAVCALLPVCNISHFCRTSTSPLHFHLCASRQQGKQQWAFYTAIKAYPSITKQRIPVLLRGRLNSLIILSWLYLGINRNTRKCIHPCFRKKCDSARTFLHIAQFRMKAPDEIIDGQNVWSYSCPRRWRVQSGVIAALM